MQLAALLGFIGLALLAGLASSSVALVNMRGWYAGLSSPLFAPPSPVPVAAWGFLAAIYVSMAVAAWRVWRRTSRVALQRSAMNAWGWQLALGAAWPAVFFGFHAMLAALALVVALVLSVALTIWRFTRLDAAGAILLAPYMAFAGVATYLVAGFWWLNH